jgi:tRNA G26 N,N-dimethylase Trm1
MRSLALIEGDGAECFAATDNVPLCGSRKCACRYYDGPDRHTATIRKRMRAALQANAKASPRELNGLISVWAQRKVVIERLLCTSTK